MEYFVGVALALGTGIFTTVVGFDRDRSLYPAILLVIASYYDLFAVMGGSAVISWETGIFAAFALAATIGFRTNLWIVVGALVGHGLLDLFHGQLIENSGVPTWWPMFCLSFDAAAGAYLAWRLVCGKIEATNTPSFGRRIKPYVDVELGAAKAAEVDGDALAAFHRLERAHILGQWSTVQHIRVHMRMLMWGISRHDQREVVGQILRVIGAAAGTFVGLVPQGNTGGANVSALRSMTVPEDLASQIERARAPVANAYGSGGGSVRAMWQEPHCGDSERA